MKKKVRICMLGAGRVGKRHSSSILRYIPGGKVVALVDPIEKTLNETGEEFGIEARYLSLEQALEKIDFEAVVITTPTPTHKPLAVLAASQGKHVFLEKPMALDLRECDEMMEAVNTYGVILQLGFMRRFDPEFAAAAQRIHAGEIGKPMIIKSLSHGPGVPPGAWARDLKSSNGNLAEVNNHDWDAVRWLSGSNYSRVYAETANFKGETNQIFTEHYYDTALVNIRFESGALGSISSVCPCGYGYDARMEIIGEKGIMQIGGLNSQAVAVCVNRDQGVVTPIYRTWSERFNLGYIYEMEHFIDCVQRQKQPSVGGEEGRWAVAGVLAATKSFLEVRPVSLSEIMDQPQ